MTSRQLLFLALRATLIPAFLRHFVQPRRVTVLLYHDPSPAVMARHLRIITRHYEPITLDQLIRARAATTPGHGAPASARLPKRPLLLTLDDGHRGNAALADVWHDSGIRPVVFLCSGIVGTSRHFWWHESPDSATTERLKRVPNDERLRLLERFDYSETREYAERAALTAGDIEQVQRLADLGSHTMFHPILPNCDDQRAALEVVASRAQLRHEMGIDARAFAYPNGDHTDRDVELVRRAGYECAFTTGPGLASLRGDAFRIPRVWIYDSASDSELIVELSGMWSGIEPRIGWLRPAVRRARRTLRRGR